MFFQLIMIINSEVSRWIIVPFAKAYRVIQNPFKYNIFKIKIIYI